MRKQIEQKQHSNVNLLGHTGLLISLLGGSTAPMTTTGTALAGHLAPATDLLAVQVEDDGDGDHDGREAAEQGTRPLDTEVIEHLVTEEREAGAEEGSEQRVGGDARRREHQVRVDQVVEALQEDAQDAESRQHAAQGWRHPVDRFREACPAEPKMG